MATRKRKSAEPGEAPVKAPRKPREKKEEKPVEIAIPPAVDGIDEWIIFGLDPSLSRTGYAVMHITRGEDRSHAKWLDVGSISPEDSSDPQWVRSKALALSLRDKFKAALEQHFPEKDFSRTGLIISFEAPTPGNDFLITISRILHLVLFEAGSPMHQFARKHVQMTNASTLRRLMGLVQKGNKNKKENVARAYSFLDQDSYPNLDTDACDAVLMSMMARYSAAIFMGFPNTLPERFLVALCDASRNFPAYSGFHDPRGY